MKSGNRNGRVCLQLSRGNWITIAVILGVGLVSLVTQTGQTEDRKFAFGSDVRPVIRRQLEKNLPLGPIEIDAELDHGLRFYKIQSAEGRFEAPQIRFVDASRATVGWIELVSKSTMEWPPKRQSFPDAALFLTHIDAPTQITDSSLAGDRPSASIFRYHTKTERYENISIEWVSPVLSLACPHRSHLGRLELGEDTVLFTVIELHATSATTDYQSGVFRNLVDAVHSSSRATDGRP